MIQASDARSWCHCPRRAWYDHRPPPDLIIGPTPFDVLIAKAGQAHEAGIRAKLGGGVRAKSPADTAALMAEGVPLIYQPAFEEHELGLEGRPDFLIRSPDGDYQVADAKLATRLDDHPEISLQLALYRRLVGTRLPALVYSGTGDAIAVALDADLQAEHFLNEFQATLACTHPPLTHFGETKCSACPYDAVCRPAFEQAGELTMVFGVNARTAEGLRDSGIRTMAELAAVDPEKLPDIPHLTSAGKKRRAVLQARSQLTGEVFVLQPPKLPAGTWVHFDVETNPLAATPGGEVYLWGFLPPPYRPASYERVWSDGGLEEDKRAWRELLSLLESYRHRFPELRIVHFSAFEATRIKTYAQRFAMENHPAVAWLLGDDSPLFDLAEAVRQRIVLPLPGYGLKAICKHPKLVNFQWELPQSGSQWSVVRYIDYLRAREPAERAAIRREIETYNRDDVLATRALEIWVRKFAAPDHAHHDGSAA